jgi:hypothetical protein
MKQSSGIILGAIVILVIVVGALYLYGGSPSTSGTGPGSATASTTGGSQNPGGGYASVKPVIETSGYAAVSSTTAVVVGKVIPGPNGTQYWFEYGTTIDFGSSTPVTNAAPSENTIGAGGYLKGLKPSTQYYFRIAAKNSAGIVYGGPYRLLTSAK